MNYISSPVADEVVIVYCAAIIFIPDSRRVSVRIVEVPQSTASAECFILQAVANIVIFVLQTNIGNSFRCSQSVNVISKANIYRSELHRRKLSAVLPCKYILALVEFCSSWVDTVIKLYKPTSSLPAESKPLRTQQQTVSVLFCSVQQAFHLYIPVYEPKQM